MRVAFLCCFRQGVAGMSRDLGRDVPDLEKLYARKLWADFSYPIFWHFLKMPDHLWKLFPDHLGLREVRNVVSSCRADMWQQSAHTWDRPRPAQGLPGPSGPEPWKSPKRVPRRGTPESRKSAPRGTLRGLCGPRPGGLFRDSFRTLPGSSGPEGPGRPCAGRGRS